MSNTLYWSEKYRPKTLVNVVGNARIVSRFSTMVGADVIMHMLLSGQSGVGKSTIVKCFLNEWFRKRIDLLQDPTWLKNLGLTKEEWFRKLWLEGVLELNASDERKVETVRRQVQNFASKYSKILPPGVFKVVLLDEVDSMQSIAQEALTHIIDQYESSTRFILICNNPEKIIPELHSRTAEIQFAPVSSYDILNRIKHVLTCENLPFCIADSALLNVIDSKNGDVRSSFNAIQSICNNLNKLTESKGEVIGEVQYSICESKQLQGELKQLNPEYTFDDIKQFIEIAPNEASKQLVQYCMENNVVGALSCLKNLKSKSLTVKQVIGFIYDYLCGSKYEILIEQEGKRQNWNLKQLKAKREILAKYHARVYGNECDHWIQLVSLTSLLCC